MIIFLLFWLALDLAAATGHVLASTRDITSQIILPKTNQPLLSPHQNVAPQAHPSVMLHSGYLLPQVCGDQNNPPEFITALRAVTPLSRLPVVLQPNRLTVLTPPNHTDAVLLERFNSSWIPSAGQVIAASNGAIHLITPVNNNGSIQLTYISATIRTQQILLISLALSLLLMIPIKHGKI